MKLLGKGKKEGEHENSGGDSERKGEEMVRLSGGETKKDEGEGKEIKTLKG